MKQFITLIILVFALGSVFSFHPSEVDNVTVADVADCTCATVRKETTSWCTGSRGGQYCIYQNKKGELAKYYKPKPITK